MNRRRHILAMIPNKRPSWGTTLVVVCSLVTAVVAAALAVTVDPPRPAGISQSQSRSSIIATPGQLDDKRQVELLPEIREGGKLVVAATGILTEFDCRQGMVLRSGSFPVSINGQGLLAISTSVPIWRDLAPGVKGEDVRALQRALQALGPSLTVTGRFDSATRERVRSIFKTAGTSWRGPNLKRESLIWIPPASTVVSTCDAALGQSLQPGSGILTFQPTTVAFVPKAVPVGLVPGRRVLTLDGVSVEASNLSSVSEPGSISMLSKTGAFRTWLESGGKVPIVASFTLIKPVPVVSVPAGAVQFDVENNPCIHVSDGRPIRVSVAGSSLGRSLVTWDDVPDHPIEVLARVGAESRC